MRPALKPQPPATPPPRPLTPAHHELLRLLARLLAADYVAELQDTPEQPGAAKRGGRGNDRGNARHDEA